MENYKEKYEQALERCKKEFNFNNLAYSHEEIKQRLENVFPELKESDDEQIKNEIIDYLKGFIPHHNDDLVAKSKLWISWLEKQGEKNLSTDFSDLRTWKYIVDAVWTEKEGIGQYLDSPFTEETAKKLQKRFGNIEQKPADKVEPKFKIGDWITIDNPCQIISIDGNYIVQYCDDETTREISKKFCESQFHTWTIQDAKDGDIIANGDMVLIFKCLEEPSYRQHIIAHIGLDINGNIQVTNESWNLGLDWAKPATKEQRELLFQKMKEAGYEWDAEKKELKKMKQKTTKLPNGEDYGIDSLYHAARILEKTLGDVEGYQSDDGILEHKCAIEAVNRLYKQKPAKWSEEDELMLNDIITCNERHGYLTAENISWLKSLKPQPKQKWSEGDEIILNKIIQDYEAVSKSFCGHRGKLDWLKSLKERVQSQSN